MPVLSCCGLPCFHGNRRRSNCDKSACAGRKEGARRPGPRSASPHLPPRPGWVLRGHRASLQAGCGKGAPGTQQWLWWGLGNEGGVRGRGKNKNELGSGLGMEAGPMGERCQIQSSQVCTSDISVHVGMRLLRCPPQHGCPKRGENRESLTESCPAPHGDRLAGAPWSCMELQAPCALRGSYHSPTAPISIQRHPLAFLTTAEQIWPCGQPQGSLGADTAAASGGSVLQQAARTQIPHTAWQQRGSRGRHGTAAAGFPPHLLQVDEDFSYRRGLSSCHFGSGPKGLGKISTLLFHRQAPSKPGEWHNLWREGRTRECRGRLPPTALSPRGS